MAFPLHKPYIKLFFGEDLKCLVTIVGSWGDFFNVPIPSMYGIFSTYIYHKNQPNVGKYTIRGSYGVSIVMDPEKKPESEVMPQESVFFSKKLWHGAVKRFFFVGWETKGYSWYEKNPQKRDL